MAASNAESDNAPVTTSAPPPPPRVQAPARKPPPSTGPSASLKNEGKGKGIAGKIFGFVLGTSSTTVRLDMQRPAFTRDRARQTNHNGWGDGPADVRGEKSDGPVRHNFNVEQTRLKVTQKWEAGAFTRLGDGGAKKSRVDLGVGLDVSLMEAEARSIPDDTGLHTTPSAWWTPILKDFLSRRAFLSAHHPSLSIPTRLDAFQLCF